jgi:hypothetical protein
MKRKLTTIMICSSLMLAAYSYGQTKTVNPVITSEFPSSSPSEDVSKINDRDLSTKFFNSQQKAQWFQYEFASSVVFNQYTLSSANDVPSRDPKSWTLKGSEDGTNWVDLDTKSGEKFADRKTSNNYSFPNKKSFKFYRLQVTETNNGPLQFSEWNLSLTK